MRIDIIGRIIVYMAISYFLVLLVAVAFQREFLFRALPYGCESRATPDLERFHFWLSTPDQERLDALWLPSGNPKAATILYLHGNAANLRCREHRLKALADLGVSVLAIDWRGFGVSTGMPSEEGLLLDANTAFGWLIQRTDPSRIIVFAESIATGIGVKLAAEHNVGALVLEAPYFSALDLAEKYLPFIPVRAFMRDPLRSDLWIGDIHTSLLIQHGKQDHLIPFSQGRRLFEIAREPKQIIYYPLGHHDDLPEKQNSYRDLKKFIDETFPAP